MVGESSIRKIGESDHTSVMEEADSSVAPWSVLHTTVAVGCQHPAPRGGHTATLVDKNLLIQGGQQVRSDTLSFLGFAACTVTAAADMVGTAADMCLRDEGDASMHFSV